MPMHQRHKRDLGTRGETQFRYLFHRPEDRKTARSFAADTTSADFVLRLKQDFFQEKARTLVTLIANRWLRFVELDEHGNSVDIPY